MEWDELEVAAAEHPGDIGAAVSAPIFRIRGDHGLVRLRDIAAQQPEVGVRILAEELDDGARTGTWVRTPSWAAQRYFTAVVTSPSFCSTTKSAGADNAHRRLTWSEVSPSVFCSYSTIETVTRWRDECWLTIFRYAEITLTRREVTERHLKDLELVLRNIRFVLDIGSTARWELLGLLASVSIRLDPGKAQALASLVRREFPDREAEFAMKLHEAVRTRSRTDVAIFGRQEHAVEEVCRL